MNANDELERWRGIGQKLLAGENPPQRYLPFQAWKDFDLRFTVEYPVFDMAAELGFYRDVIGIDFLSVDPAYAILTDPAHSFTFSLQAADQQYDLSMLKVQWFTDSFDAVCSTVEARTKKVAIEKTGVQRILRLHSPAGVCVEIWSGDETRA